MNYILFKNELGQILFSGSARTDNASGALSEFLKAEALKNADSGCPSGVCFPIRAVSGLGVPEKIYTAREYIGLDGQNTVSSRFDARTITIGFDIVTAGKIVNFDLLSFSGFSAAASGAGTPNRGSAESANSAEPLKDATSYLFRVLSREGTLYFASGTTIRRIFANRISISDFTSYGNRARAFSAQFICDNPYFFDEKAVYVSCYSIKNNLKYDEEAESWHLDTPTKWGLLENDTVIENSGITRAFPTFIIRAASSSSSPSQESETAQTTETAQTNADTSSSAGGFEILRTDINDSEKVIQKFKICRALQDGEEVTLCFNPRSDKGRRYIENSDGESLLNYRSEDSSLSDFYLEPGKNRIIVNNLSENGTISAYLSYENSYIEGGF